jgi:hypothetical protein
MGLTPHRSGYDSQVAEENHRDDLGEPGKIPGSFYWNLIISLFDKGKTVERR